jgi:LuxR family quorum sensing-dependent transcriptional regulator
MTGFAAGTHLLSLFADPWCRLGRVGKGSQMDRRVADIRRNAFEFVENIQRVSSTGEIMDALGSVLSQHGFDYFCCAFVVPISIEHRRESVLAERLPAGFLDLYHERKYVYDDPALRYCKTTVRPFRWFREAPYDAEREPRAVEVVQSARDFGMLDGFVIPVVSPAGRMGQVWFGGRTLDLPEHQLPALHLMAIYAFDRSLKLHGSPAQHQVSLTPREREILTLAANGKSSWEIGVVLHISSRTVKAHIKHVCQKLGAVTRTQAVMIAVRDKIIQP